MPLPTPHEFARHMAKGQQTLNSTDYKAIIAEIAEDMRHLNKARLGIITDLATALRLTSWGLDAATTEFTEKLSFDTLIHIASALKIPHDEESWLDDEYPDKEAALRVAVAEALHRPPADKQPEPTVIGHVRRTAPHGQAEGFDSLCDKDKTNPMPLGGE